MASACSRGRRRSARPSSDSTSDQTSVVAPKAYGSTGIIAPTTNDRNDEPAASQGLGRLRAMLGDALFERHGAGVRPTPRADRLAQSVQLALGTIEEALNASQVFDPQRSGRVLRVHLSDIGEARFLPELVLALQRQAPGMRLEALPMAHDQIGPALDNGQLDLAIGFLPEVSDTLQQPLLSDRYVLLMRKGHPMASGPMG